MLIKKIPNYLTYFRILVIPLIILTFYSKESILIKQTGAALFLAACISDFFDGYLARKFNCQSKIGEILDPIADKILVASMLIMLVKHKNVNEIPAILILVREIAVTGIRGTLSAIKVNLKVSNIAKVKTFIQMLALFLFLLGDIGSGLVYVDKVASSLLWIASIITIYTGYCYFLEYKNQFLT